MLRELVQLAERDLSLAGVLSMSSVNWRNTIRGAGLFPKRPLLRVEWNMFYKRLIKLIETITNLLNWDISKWHGCWYNLIDEYERKDLWALLSWLPLVPGVAKHCIQAPQHELWDRCGTTVGPLWRLRLASSPDHAFVFIGLVMDGYQEAFRSYRCRKWIGWPWQKLMNFYTS